MYKLCKTEKTTKRQKEIELTLCSMMQKQDYKKITVSDLCKEMQMPRKSFYSYFGTKEDVLFALIENFLKEAEFYGDETKRNSNLSVLEQIKQYLLFWKSKKDLLDGLARSELMGLLVQKTIAHSIENDDSLQINWPKDSKNRKMSIMFAVSGIMSVIALWHYGDFEESEEELARKIAEILTNPIFEDSLQK